MEVLNEAVAAELDGWPEDVRAALVKIVERIEAVGLQNVREPHVKHLQGKLWEMRPSAGGKDGRAVYVTAKGSRIVIVAAFLKKSRKTPKHWIALAQERAREVL